MFAEIMEGKKYLASVSAHVSVLMAWTIFRMKSEFILVPISAMAVVCAAMKKEWRNMKERRRRMVVRW